jgi:hypothetical protein
MASFIGFAPANNPRFATLVALDENNLSYGGEVAAPVFAEITKFALQQYGISATDQANTQFGAAQATATAAGNSCTVPHGADLAAAQARLQAQLQAQSQTRAGSQNPSQHQGSGAGTTADSLPPDPSKHT